VGAGRESTDGRNFSHGRTSSGGRDVAIASVSGVGSRGGGRGDSSGRIGLGRSGDLHVTQTGTGSNCTLADPCGSVADALTAHRAAPQPDDVIDVGPGTFVGNVEADQVEDDGLTIRGTVSGGTTATCPLGTRDKGAYEYLGPSCVLQAPEIIGGANPTVGTQLTSTRGVFSNKPTSYARLWLRSDASGDNCAPIDPPKTRQGYSVRGSDVGHTLRVQVTPSNAAGDSDPAVSDPTGVVSG
jgi:hypothetical protein